MELRDIIITIISGVTLIVGLALIILSIQNQDNITIFIGIFTFLISLRVFIKQEIKTYVSELQINKDKRDETIKLRDVIEYHRLEMCPKAKMTDIQYTYFQGYCNALKWVQKKITEEKKQ